jgi:hypothetical protein
MLNALGPTDDRRGPARGIAGSASAILPANATLADGRNIPGTTAEHRGFLETFLLKIVLA